MVFENVFSNFLANFNNFVDKKYILSDTAFVRGGKWSLETTIKFSLFNRNKTKFNEVNRYLRSQTGDYSMKITGSGVCDRMQYINPKVYMDMNDGVIMEIYNNVEEMKTLKDFTFLQLMDLMLKFQIILKHVKKWGFHQIMELKHLLQMQESPAQ